MFGRSFATACLAAYTVNAVQLPEAWVWNETDAYVSLHLSNYAYCGHDMYASLDWQGDTTGFVYTKTIYNPDKDTEGFVGYLPSDNAIYVSFRGSSSLENWETNLNALQAPYVAWPECNCEVHNGFQAAADAVAWDVINEVQRLHDLYPTYAIKTTGHSLGGALAHLMGMILLKEGFDVSMINFGQPRVGDGTYAAFARNVFPKVFRQTHAKDPVPHVPQRIQGDYTHIPTEIYEYKDVYHTCDGTGEDPNCSDYWHSW